MWGGFSLQNIIMGILGTGLGIWIAKEAFWINHHLLFLGFVEKKYGPGSGTIAYKFLGLFIALFSVLVLIGIIDLYGTAFNGNAQIVGNDEDPAIIQPQFSPGGNNRIAD